MLGIEGAKDASQEVWIRVWANIGSFKGESAFSTWLYRITLNTCLSVQRRESRRGEREVDEEMPHLSEPPGGDDDPEAEVLRSERREEVRVALSNVRKEHRAALVLPHIEGLSYAEIAKALDVPDGTAKGWVSRGRAAMLVTLARRGGPRYYGAKGYRGRGASRGTSRAPPERISLYLIDRPERPKPFISSSIHRSARKPSRRSPRGAGREPSGSRGVRSRVLRPRRSAIRRGYPDARGPARRRGRSPG